jgi:SnoaL-like domain
MVFQLPANLTRYFAAQNGHDLEAMLAAFAPDAEVRDEGHSYVGPDAIREWKLATSAKYRITARPLRMERKGDALAATVEVSGNFPGSPANLTYDFLLDGSELIRRLEIH